LISNTVYALHFSSKPEKLLGQNKVQIFKLPSQNFTFLGRQIGCPT